MNHSAWSDWSSQAIDDMNQKMQQCFAQFSIDNQPYTWDLEKGEIEFLQPDDPIVADLTVIGTGTNNMGQFTWSWANQDIPEQVKKDVQRIREFGQTQGFELLTSPSFNHLPIDPMELLTVSGYLLNAENVFIDEVDGQVIYFIMKNFRSKHAH